TPGRAAAPCRPRSARDPRRSLALLLVTSGLVRARRDHRTLPLFLVVQYRLVVQCRRVTGCPRRGHAREGVAMVGRGAESAQGGPVLVGAVALWPLEPAATVTAGRPGHDLVPGHLGDDRGRGHAAGDLVALLDPEDGG